MLGSITRLGESGRHARWGVTAGWFAVGAIAGGTLIGGALGLLGSIPAGLIGPRWAVVVLAVVAALGLAFDLRLGGLRVPSPRRQVDEQWLGRYRGWVYGVGFGFQLGLGVVTIVTTSAVYAMLAAAALSGSATTGALIGGAFGAVRAASVLPGGRVRRPVDLIRVDGRLERLDPLARRATLVAVACVPAVLAAVAVAWR